MRPFLICEIYPCVCASAQWRLDGGPTSVTLAHHRATIGGGVWWWLSDVSDNVAVGGRDLRSKDVSPACVIWHGTRGVPLVSRMVPRAPGVSRVSTGRYPARLLMWSPRIPRRGALAWQDAIYCRTWRSAPTKTFRSDTRPSPGLSPSRRFLRGHEGPLTTAPHADFIIIVPAIKHQSPNPDYTDPLPCKLAFDVHQITSVPVTALLRQICLYNLLQRPLPWNWKVDIIF